MDNQVVDVIGVVGTCFVCENRITKPSDSFTTGYGVDNEGHKICYACCAKADREYMIEHGKIMLYLTCQSVVSYIRHKGYRIPGNAKITNWPGSLEFSPVIVWARNHNIAGVVYYARFIGPDGCVWSGKCVGNFTQIIHCRRTKLSSIYV